MKSLDRQAETNKTKAIVSLLSLNFEETSCKPAAKRPISITVEVMAFVSDRRADKQAVQMYINKPLCSTRKQGRLVGSTLCQGMF